MEKKGHFEKGRWVEDKPEYPKTITTYSNRGCGVELRSVTVRSKEEEDRLYENIGIKDRNGNPLGSDDVRLYGGGGYSSYISFTPSEAVMVARSDCVGESLGTVSKFTSPPPAKPSVTERVKSALASFLGRFKA